MPQRQNVERRYDPLQRRSKFMADLREKCTSRNRVRVHCHESFDTLESERSAVISI